MAGVALGVVKATVDDDFAEWVAPRLLAMTRLAARLAPDDEPDEVVQEALVRAWRRRSTYDPARGAVGTWLLAIVADRARRARVRRRPRRDPERPVPVSDPDADLDLQRAIQLLPRRQRLAVELHYYVGLGIVECAAVMGCTEGTVKSTLSDARNRLAKLLEVRS